MGAVGAADAATASPFSERSFRLFWFSRVCSTIASSAQAVAIGWQLYALTGSAFDLGLVGLAQFIPMVTLTLAVGHVADRFDRRRVAAICQAVEALAVGAILYALWTGSLTRGAILAVAMALGAARAFENPTLQALLPTLVAREIFPKATAWSASANQTAQIIGPAAGGLLYLIGPLAPFAFSALLFLAAALCALSIRPPTIERRVRPATLASLFSGFAYVWSKPVLLGVITLDLFAVLLGSTTALLPIIARDVLATGSWGLGLLRASPALGALAMSVILAKRQLDPPAGRKLFAAVAVFGGATVAFGLSNSLWLSMLALALVGAADVISVVIRLSLVQLSTPDEMRGRVSAVNFLGIGTSNQLGDFRSGVVAALIGAVPAVIVGGLSAIAISLLWQRLFPGLRRIERLETHV